ncbi:MAG: hypothetical protein PHQ67_10140 [Fermentimonas sp.]|nr:hypothetical protein [Fermentimonas sp.]MDD4697849.1 hypothetical protein [Fermentimonas sp.]
MKTKLLSLFIFGFLFTVSMSAQETDTDSYPNFTVDGTLKNKFEYATGTDVSRFTVRNSRIGIKGNINTFSSYRAQVELSDEGKFKVLDLSGTISPVEGLSFTMGQTSIPLFNNYIVSPSEMMFANRAFLGKYFISTRDLGINAKYKFNIGTVPANLEFGLYNGNAINDPVWKKNMSMGGRVILGNMDGLRFSAKIYDYPNNDSTHFVFYGADLRYEINNFKVETEIMKSDSRTELNNDMLSYYFQSAYRVPVKSKFFDYFLPAARWDAIDERFDEKGFDTNRLTVGLGLGFNEEKFSSIIRLDYEWYFINNSMSIFDKNDQMDSDKLTLELLFTF